MTVYKKSVNLGAYAKKGEDFRDGDIIHIANEGQEIEGTFGPQTVFMVKFKNGEEKNMTFNRTSINSIIDAYGEDSKEWVGKPIKVWLIMQSVAGKMLKVTYLTHPKAEMQESSNGMEWKIPGKKTVSDMGAPVTAPSSDDINIDEIPF